MQFYFMAKKTNQPASESPKKPIQNPKSKAETALPAVRRALNPHKEWVRKANDLVEARYKFDIWETRLFLKLLSLIDRDETQFKGYYKFYLTEFVRDFQLENARATYKLVEEAGQSMVQKVIALDTQDERRKARAYTGLFTEFVITDEDDSQNYVKISLSKWLKPYLLELKDRYLSYDFRNVAPLSSPHHVRIYELLKQYEKIGHRRFSVEGLKYKMELENKYQSYGHFKQDILEPAKRTLKTHCDISFEYEEVKKGRKVMELIFYIHANNDQNKATTERKNTLPKAQESKSTVSEIAEVEVVETALTWLDDYAEELKKEWQVSPSIFILKAAGKSQRAVDNAIAFTRERVQAGKAANPAGVFLDALEKGYVATEQQKADEKALERKKQLEKQAFLQQRREQLQEQKKEIEAMRDLELNEAIRQLVEEQPEVRDKAFAVIKNTPVDRYQKALLPYQGAPSDDNFRHDPVLRGFVIEEIKRRNFAVFAPITRRYAGQIGAIEEELKSL